MKESGEKTAIRVYSGPLKEEKIKLEDTGFKLISVPFYLLPRLVELIY